MKQLTFRFFLLITVASTLAIQSCKPKKIVQKPAPQPVTAVQLPPPVQKTPDPAPAPPPPPVVQKPDYNFNNIQFEFNSGILKTDAYPILDKAATEMKKDPSVKFILNGYASAEGTADHNMELSAQRANSVKIYLVNSGVNAASLATKGYGESNPISENTDEAGRALNRRVEIKKQ
ncbi:OmpA family protein [Mucilaginibacter sp.]|uniref:OmpA family protein n=1 Tax=Mucilaginibacter sp. TaxID=1882438 RepID=UPI003D102937